MVQLNASIQRRDSSKIPGKYKNMSNRLMTPADKIIVKRRYFKPIPPDPEFESMRKTTHKYKTRERSKKCTTCPNIATQMFCCDVDGAVFVEKYCDTCIKENKHTEENEVMTNFDSLFVRAEPRS